MRNARMKYYSIIIVSAIIIVLFGLYDIFKIYNMSTSDRAFTGAKDDGGTITLERKDPVKVVLEDIYSSRMNNVFDDINKIEENDSIPDGIKIYFRDFKEYYKFAVGKEKGAATTISTMTFINNSSILEAYFKNSSKQENLSKSTIVPYYFIKNFNSLNSKQKEEKAVYKAYIDHFVTGNTSLNPQAANVICLYVYACYESASKPKDFENLKSEIEKFIAEYKVNLGENGDMNIQRNYLETSQEILRKKPKNKGWLPQNRIKSYPTENL